LIGLSGISLSVGLLGSVNKRFGSSSI